MRNILQYPVTFDEKVNLLAKLSNQFLEENKINLVCGDMKSLILQEIIEDLHRLRGLENEV